LGDEEGQAKAKLIKNSNPGPKPTSEPASSGSGWGGSSSGGPPKFFSKGGEAN